SRSGGGAAVAAPPLQVSLGDRFGRRRNQFTLAWAAARALAVDDPTAVEELAAPHADRLAPADGTLQARLAEGARVAERLRLGDLDRILAEEQRDQRRVARCATGLRPADRREDVHRTASSF